MAFSYKPAGLTKTWKITVFCLCILIMYVVTWFLVGEFNGLHTQWLIAKEGSVWSGTITAHNYQWLWNNYHDQIHHGYYSINTVDDFKSYIGKSQSILAYQTMFNPLILIPLLITLAIAVGLPLIMKIFGLMNIDTLPFSITLSLTAIVFNFTGLIPHTFNTAGLWIIRILILLICLFVFFILFNSWINRIIANSSEAEQAIVDYSAQAKDKQDVKQSLTQLTDEYKKQDAVTYVEEEKNIV